MTSIVLFNLIFYLPVLYLYDLKPAHSNKYADVSNQGPQCVFSRQNSEKIPFFMIFTNRVFFPFLFLCSSCLLIIIAIYKTRKRVKENFTFRENETFKRDIKLTLTSLCLNVFYILLNLPVILLYFLANYSDLIVQFTANLIMFNYAIKFYLVLLFNESYRRELTRFLLYKKFSNGNTSTNNNIIQTETCV